nr:MAG TPA: hypothetical protein [Caudoviricetes sp.]
MAQDWDQRPSKILNIEEEYAAYCFDQACSYILGELKDGKTPTFYTKHSSFTDIYKQYS